MARTLGGARHPGMYPVSVGLQHTPHRRGPQGPRRSTLSSAAPQADSLLVMAPLWRHPRRPRRVANRTPGRHPRRPRRIANRTPGQGGPSLSVGRRRRVRRSGPISPTHPHRPCKEEEEEEEEGEEEEEEEGARRAACSAPLRPRTSTRTHDAPLVGMPAIGAIHVQRHRRRPRRPARQRVREPKEGGRIALLHRSGEHREVAGELE